MKLLGAMAFLGFSILAALLTITGLSAVYEAPAENSLEAPLIIVSSNDSENFLEFHNKQGVVSSVDPYGVFTSFTGGHDYVTSNSAVSSWVQGAVLKTTGASFISPFNPFSVICELEQTTSAFDTGVVGVFVGQESSEGRAFRIKGANDEFLAVTQVNAVGDGVIRVTDDNGDVFNGDLVVSSQLPGIAMLQSTPGIPAFNGVIQSFTIAKITESIDWDDPNDFEIIEFEGENFKVATVTCVYLCGG